MHVGTTSPPPYINWYLPYYNPLEYQLVSPLFQQPPSQSTDLCLIVAYFTTTCYLTDKKIGS